MTRLTLPRAVHLCLMFAILYIGVLGAAGSLHLFSDGRPIAALIVAVICAIGTIIHIGMLVEFRRGHKP